jgi:hypothetical protein
MESDNKRKEAQLEQIQKVVNLLVVKLEAVPPSDGGAGGALHSSGGPVGQGVGGVGTSSGSDKRGGGTPDGGPPQRGDHGWRGQP